MCVPILLIVHAQVLKGYLHPKYFVIRDAHFNQTQTHSRNNLKFSADAPDLKCGNLPRLFCPRSTRVGFRRFIVGASLQFRTFGPWLLKW